MTQNFKVHETTKCRICKSRELVEVFSLGEIELSGYFPKEKSEVVPAHPLKLIKCSGKTESTCGLVQLKYYFDSNVLYGDKYGYRSGLNSSMVNHLRELHYLCLTYTNLSPGDLVIDIAGNDGTFLGNFSENLNLLSIDPISAKFSKIRSNVKGRAVAKICRRSL